MKKQTHFVRVLLGLALAVALTSNAKTQVRAEQNAREIIYEEVTPNTASGKWGDLSWKVSGSTLSITGSGEMKNGYSADAYPWAEYASSVDTVKIGNKVTSIAQYAFSNMKLVDTVKIGTGVKVIGECAFYDVDSLLSVTVPKSVTTIANWAFYSCDNLVEVEFASGSKLTSIGKSAFYDCVNLLSFKLPSKVTTIGHYAFNNCANLVEFTFNEKLQTIGDQAFGYCINLLEVDLPDTVQTIGDYAFIDCNNLISVDIKSGMKEIGIAAFRSCERITGTVNIPSTVTYLGNYVFEDCANIQEALVYCAADIPVYAFEGCTNLKKVTIGSKVTGIKDYAFYNTKLSTVKIPGAVSGIGYGAFQNVTTLKNVTLSSGLTYIDCFAFNSTSIESITIPDTCTVLEDCAFSENTSLKTVKLGAGVTGIGSSCFKGCSNLVTVSMGNKVNTIESSAFEGCTSLKNFTWSGNLNKIDSYAFYACSALEEANLPEALNSIGYRAFEYCTALSYVELGGNVTYIDGAAFYNCTSLSKFKSYSGNIEFGWGNIFDNCPVTVYSWADSALEEMATTYGIPFVAITKLDTPVNNKVENTVSGVKVSWHAVRGASYYTLYRSTSLNGTYSPVKNVIAGLNYTDTEVSSGKTYYYKVKANNTCANSDLSAAQKVTYVKAPKIKSCTNISTGIKVKWNKVSGATGYAVYRKTTKGSWTRVYTAKSGNTVSWTDKSIKSKNGTTYKYAIRAIKGEVLSGWDTKGVTTVRLTTRTLKSVTQASKTSVKCKWTTSSSVSGYQIRVMQNGKVVKTVTVKDKKTATKTITGLKTGKKYKIQVRSYKTVSSKKYYSAWSSSKSITLKK